MAFTQIPWYNLQWFLLLKYKQQLNTHHTIMTLPFSTTWPKHMKDLAGQPNYFQYKILKGLLHDGIIDTDHYEDLYQELVGINYGATETYDCDPKLHTLRTDPKNRWKADMPIHFVIHNRTKNRFQFAPITKCVSVQKVVIKWNCLNESFYSPLDSMNKVKHILLDGNSVSLQIDNKRLNIGEISNLATNDGFPSLEAFFDYFNTDFEGKIIHWTDRKY